MICGPAAKLRVSESLGAQDAAGGALLVAACASAAGLRVAPGRATLQHNRLARSRVVMCDPSKPLRAVRVEVRNTELLSARTAQKQEQSSKKGIESVSFGGMTINFSHDMTSTFKWGGLILGLVLIKIIRKGKYAWTEEPNFK